MSSISLSAGMKSSLMSLQSTQKLVESTQEHMTTGKKVAKPSDDPAAYYAAVTLTDRAGDLSNRLDGMGQAVQPSRPRTTASARCAAS
jgi:flagellin-like hook-associated protein FlgL